jgi:hypothetical protein
MVILVFFLEFEGRKGIKQDGYLFVYDSDSKSKRTEHGYRAKRALGKSLPKGTKVHHHNCDQLVICESNSYHKLLHRRMVKSGYHQRFWNNRIKEIYNH